MNLNQVTLPSSDIPRSIAFYRGMGFTCIVESPHYARSECPEGEATFSVHLITDTNDADEAKPVSADAAAAEDSSASVSLPHAGAVVYFESDRLDELVAELQSEGYEFDQEPTDERWLWREARLRDPDGNQICLFFAGENRRNPPWRVAGV